jgi:BMFP domain-containing protein YqiC
MTKEEWDVIGEVLDAIKERFDDQEKRIKSLEAEIKELTGDSDWIYSQLKGVREAQ